MECKLTSLSAKKYHSKGLTIAFVSQFNIDAGPEAFFNLPYGESSIPFPKNDQIPPVSPASYVNK